MENAFTASYWDETRLASQTIKWSVLVLLLVFGRTQVVRLKPRPRGGPCWTLLDLAYTVLLLGSALLTTVSECYELIPIASSTFAEASVLQNIAANAALVVSLLTVATLSWCRLLRVLGSSGFAFSLLGLLAVATALDAVVLDHQVSAQAHSVVIEAVSNSRIILTLTVAVLLSGGFLAAGIQDTVLKRSSSSRDETCGINRDEDNLSPFTRLLCVVLFPLFKLTMSGAKPTDEVLPRPRGILRCRDIVDRLHSLLSKNVRRRFDFLAALLRVLWMDTFRVILCTMAYFTCLFVKVPLLEQLINASDQSERTTSAALFLVTTLAECLTSIYMNELACIMGCRLRAVLQAAIFKKMTQLSPTARAAVSTGHVLSMLGVDCFQLSMSVYMFPYPVGGLLCMPVLLYLLFQRAGTKVTLCCTAYLLCVFLVSIPASRIQNALWRRQMNARDERLKQTSDLLSSVRLVKMYAWEEAYQEKLLRAREVEMKPLFWVNALDGIIDSVYSASSSVLIIILFGVLATSDQGPGLSVAASFSSVYLVYMTDVTMAQMCWALRIRSQISLSIRRIVKFCTEEEMGDHSGCCDDPKALEEKKGEVTLRNCSLSWSKHENNKIVAALNNVHLEVRPGSLIGVVGFVGSGKSSLLAGILGDMHVSGGAIKCTGRVAYVPQIANVHNMSVRDNILYGQPFNDVDYAGVLRACQLYEDIGTFPAGDLTEVGEKGETLSGGQKQRISLARAAYNRADVYLLDDPLSALDAVVAKKVFRDVIGNKGILKNKTRIMACNQGSFLNHMDKLVLIHNRGVIVYDTLKDLLNDSNAPETLQHGSVSTQPDQKLNEIGHDADLSGEGSNGRVTADELVESTKSPWQLIRALVRMSGPCIGLGLATFAVSAIALGWQLSWIKEWTQVEVGAVAVDSQEPSWVPMLAAICTIDVLARVLGSVLLAVAMRRLSSLLHSEMLSAVLSSPVSFFGSTPRGRIVNRFSVDLDHMDSRLYLSGKQFLQHTLFAFSRLVIIGTQSPLVLAVGVASSVFLAFLIRLGVRAARPAKFLEAVHTSRMMSHVTETMDSLSSIRAYGVLDRFSAHFCRLVDVNMRAYWTYCCLYRYARLVTFFCGFLVVLCTLLLTVLFLREDLPPDPSALGLSVSAASALLQTLSIMCLAMFSALQAAVGFERCLDYTELPPESEVEPGLEKYDLGPALSKTAEWPPEGKVEFQSYAASYSPGILPDVLKGITFTVNPSEKVGVVGRTGAGKSSLVMALLRVLKSSHGCIRIDGLDIARVPLRKLRSRVTIIPQDPSLVRGTLRENLDPTNSHTDEEIWAALEQSHLRQVVSRDPKQLLLDTGDGRSSFSAGQRQLLCLARALLRRPRLLVLDEATSQMDGDTDQLIQTTLREAFAHCTQITIAHRLHTILDYDKVLVMADGRVLEYGTVQELLSRPTSVFRQMAQETVSKAESEVASL